MSYHLAKLTYGPHNEPSWNPVGVHFKTANAVIDFVETDQQDIERLEVSELDTQGQLVESVSYADFADYHSHKIQNARLGIDSNPKL